MKRRMSFAILMLAAAVSGSAVSRESIALRHDAKAIETLDARVNGNPGVYLFDSGIGTSGVTPAVAAQIGCKPWGNVAGFRATGERVDFPRCNESDIVVGTYTTTLSQLSVFDLGEFMGPAATGLSGVVGLDVFAGRTITLDVARHRVTLEDADSLKLITRSAIEVPIRLVRAAEGAALTVDLGIRTPAGMAWMEVDTGNYGPSMIDTHVAAAWGLDVAKTTPQPWRTSVTQGVPIDGSVLVKPLIMDGNLGRGILHDWEITLDLAASRGWIKVREPSFDTKLRKAVEQMGH